MQVQNLMSSLNHHKRGVPWIDLTHDVNGLSSQSQEHKIEHFCIEISSNNISCGNITLLESIYSK